MARVSAVRALLEDEPLQSYWFDRTREHADRRRGLAFERLSYATPYTFHLSSLPCWEHLPAPEYQRRIAEIVPTSRVKRAGAPEPLG